MLLYGLGFLDIEDFHTGSAMKNENAAFEVDLVNQLSRKAFEGVLRTLEEPQNKPLIEANIWNIINTVCLTLKTKQLLQDDTDLDFCRKILLSLVDHGNPKEVVVALMEEADSFKSHEYFCLLLDPLRETLRKVPGKRGKSLEWVLSTLNAHVQTLALPEDADLQGEEKMLLDADPAVQDANYVLAGYFQFINAFVEEVSLRNAKNGFEDKPMDRVVHQREILQKYILILLDKPFLYHDLSATEPKSTVRTLCEDYMAALSKMCGNVFNLFKMDNAKVDMDSEDCDRVTSVAFSNLSYLVFVEKLAMNFQPFVFSQLFVFAQHIKYVLPLLSKQENLVLFKGLHLGKTLLDQLEDFEIPHQSLEMNDFNEFSRLLLSVAIFSKIETHRNMAIKVFLLYVAKCDWKGRYHLLIQSLETVDHSGAEALMISTYKNYLHQCLTGETKDTTFLGSNLKVFLKKVFILKDGVETDMLENSDRIMAAANLLRYLLLRDRKDENITGVWDLVATFSDKFLQPLSTGIDLTRAHWKQVSKDHENDRKNERKGIKTSVTVGSERLPNMPAHFEKEVFQKAFLTFDLIDLTMSRVRELL
ncbi:hypothetical protein JTE90_002193 [Oedothorax gibbosus]|uniref:Glomulin n=1 Tax=Oedothorax gibbosus TaxID=931172 RepID=A0AAV6VFJ1_9ARAC|nr:hypothetical protein JTE90_002193 [Oedothorax gibbosus]